MFYHMNYNYFDYIAINNILLLYEHNYYWYKFHMIYELHYWFKYKTKVNYFSYFIVAV